MTLEDLIEKITSTTGITKEAAVEKIREKQAELSNLVSAEGAAYIVAKEMGLDLVTRPKRNVTIDKIYADSRNFSLKARVLRIFEPKEYERGGRKFTVANVVLGDGTGSKRLTLWDRQTELTELISVGDAIEIFGGYAKENNRGEVEVRLSRFGGVKKTEDENLPKMEEVRGTSKPIVSDIRTLKANGYYKIRGALVQLFETEKFYEICPNCGKRTKMEDGKFKCEEHGEIKPAYSMVVSGIIDDGTENMRAVFFRDVGASVLGLTMQEALDRKGKLFEGIDVVGKEFVFSGRVRLNKMFNREEFIVSKVEDVDVKTESEILINNLEGDKNA